VSPASLAVVLAAIVAIPLVVWLYARREPPVRRRWLLAALRIAAVAVVVLLLLDPRIPSDAAAGASGIQLLIDASESMTAAGPDGAAPWARALARLEEEAAAAERPPLRFGGAEPAPFGGSEGAAVGDGVATRPPDRRTSLLAPALERTAEAGARSVVVITDGRIEDAAAARETARRLGLGVEVVDVGADSVVNATLTALDLPASVAAGEGVPATVAVSASDASAGDSATVEILEEGRVVWSERIALPAPGRILRREPTLPPPSREGTVRYAARVTADARPPEGEPADSTGQEGDAAPDAFPGDDRRVAFVDVDPVEGAVVLVSTVPDWESRFLLPVLEQVTGLRIRGFLAVDGDRWLVSAPRGAGGTVATSEVRPAATSAEILVVQGGGRGLPGWLGEALGNAGRAVLLPGGPTDLDAFDLIAGRALAGEWYVAPDPPPSPLAAELAGIPVERLPPLGPVLPVADTAGAVPLRLRRSGSGPEYPALLLREEAGRRRVAVLAPGLWRWAFRDTPGPDTYRRLWSGVAGWLLAGGGASGASVRPLERVAAPGEPMEWSAPAAAGDSVTLTWERLEDPEAGAPPQERPEAGAARDTTVAVPASGRFVVPAPAAGSYMYRIRRGDGVPADSGRVEVEAWSAALTHPRARGLGAEEEVEAGGGEGARGGRPLRTEPWPYLLVLVLLAVEWIGRRRKGLR